MAFHCFLPIKHARKTMVFMCFLRSWGILGGSLGSSWAILGHLGPSWAILGASWGHLGGPGALKNVVFHYVFEGFSVWGLSCIQLRLMSRHLALSSHLGAILGPTWGHHGPILGHLGAILGHLGPSWGHLGDHLGGLLEPPWASWGHLGPPWSIMGYYGPSCGHLGAILGQSWSYLGAILCHLGAMLSYA